MFCLLFGHSHNVIKCHGLTCQCQDWRLRETYFLIFVAKALQLFYQNWNTKSHFFRKRGYLKIYNFNKQASFSNLYQNIYTSCLRIFLNNKKPPRDMSFGLMLQILNKQSNVNFSWKCFNIIFISFFRLLIKNILCRIYCTLIKAHINGLRSGHTDERNGWHFSRHLA